MNDHVIDEIVSELLVEAKIDARDTETYEKIRTALTRRITSRLLIELIVLLNASQATRVRAVMDAGDASQEQAFGEIVREVPDIDIRIAELLPTIVAELLADLEPFANKASAR